MVLDPLAIRNLLIWIAFSLGSAILLGAVPSWMRCAAKRADPSLAAALFSLVFAGALTALGAFSGSLADALALAPLQILWLAVCGLLSALTWLSLFTALTGGRASRVIPVYLLYYAVSLTASHFFFGTPLGLWKICCVIVILLGIVLIESGAANPGGQLWFLYALAAALFGAALPLVRQATLGNAFDTTLYQGGRAAFASLFLWVFVLVRGRQAMLRDVSARGWAGILFAGLSFAGSIACDYFASLRGDVSELAPIGVLAFFFVMLFARLFQKEKQPGATVFGTLLVLLGQFGILMGL